MLSAMPSSGPTAPASCTIWPHWEDGSHDGDALSPAAVSRPGPPRKKKFHSACIHQLTCLTQLQLMLHKPWEWAHGMNCQ